MSEESIKLANLLKRIKLGFSSIIEQFSGKLTDMMSKEDEMIKALKIARKRE
jgi:hypothetical protein